MPKAQSRIYRVTNLATKEVRLIRGISKAAVRSFAARSSFDVEVATQNELVSFVTTGVQVEESVTPEEGTAES